MCPERSSALLRGILQPFPCYLAMRITLRSKPPSSCPLILTTPGAPRSRSCGALSKTWLPFRSGPNSAFELWKPRVPWLDSHRGHFIQYKCICTSRYRSKEGGKVMPGGIGRIRTVYGQVVRGREAKKKLGVPRSPEAWRPTEKGEGGWEPAVDESKK